MVSRKFGSAAVAVIAGLFMGAASSHAATILKSGDTVAGTGWKVTFPVGISLISDGGSNLTLEKSAAFTSLEGLDITFTQVATTATPQIIITDESVTNVSGTPFNSFQFLLQNTLGGLTGAPTLSGGFTDVSPFTTQSLNSDKNTLTLSGGTLGDTDTAKWGFGANGGELVINANPSSDGMKVIDFKEAPGGGRPMIPVPAAAWSGLSGLIGLALIGSAKKARKLLA